MKNRYFSGKGVFVPCFDAISRILNNSCPQLVYTLLPEEVL